MKITLVAVFLMVATAAHAQESVPEDVRRELAKDLAELNRLVLQLQAPYAAPTRRPEAVVITRDKAVKADLGWFADTLMTVPKGDKFPVIDKMEGWYAIQIPGKQVGWVPASGATPTIELASKDQPVPFTTVAAVAGDPFQRIIDGAALVRDKWKDNPYVFVKGFSVQMGVPPSFSLGFEFK
jgi:uncharacterized protein YgiM (DUF1202 family)